MSYDELWRIHVVTMSQTLHTISVPVTLRFIHIRHSSSYEIIMPGICLAYTRHIPHRNGIYLVYIWYISVKSHLSLSHTKYKGNGLLLLHQVTLSAEKSLLQHRSGWTKRKQRWKYTGLQYRVQAYGIWQVYQVYTTYWALTRTGLAPTGKIDWRPTHP